MLAYEVIKCLSSVGWPAGCFFQTAWEIYPIRRRGSASSWESTVRWRQREWTRAPRNGLGES